VPTSRKHWRGPAGAAAQRVSVWQITQQTCRTRPAAFPRMTCVGCATASFGLRHAPSGVSDVDAKIQVHRQRGEVSVGRDSESEVGWPSAPGGEGVLATDRRQFLWRGGYVGLRNGNAPVGDRRAEVDLGTVLTRQCDHQYS